MLITELEHHSNYVPWHFLRKSKNIKINFAEVNDDGDISLEEIEKKITSKTKVIALLIYLTLLEQYCLSKK